ncbi:hypothetical protein P7K49_022999, partial [Saguinus oedipus]
DPRTCHLLFCTPPGPQYLPPPLLHSTSTPTPATSSSALHQHPNTCHLLLCTPPAPPHLPPPPLYPTSTPAPTTSSSKPQHSHPPLPPLHPTSTPTPATSSSTPRQQPPHLPPPPPHPASLSLGHPTDATAHAEAGTTAPSILYT